MNYSKAILSFLLVAGIILSCNFELERPLRNSYNSTGRVLVVISPELWKGPVGEKLQAVLGQDFPGLAVTEPYFLLINIAPEAMKGNFELYPSILYVKTNDALAEPTVKSAHNVWALDQFVVKLEAPDEKGLAQAVEENSERLLSLFRNDDVAKFTRNLKDVAATGVTEKLKAEHDLEAIVQKDYFIARSDSNTVWLRKNNISYEEGILIHWIPYVNEEQLKPENVIMLRDSVLARNITSTQEAFMTTEKANIPPVVIKSRHRGYYALKTHGWWELVGADVKGGAFVNYTTLANDGKTILMIDGYVYNPATTEKKQFIDALEGMMNTIGFVGDEFKETVNEPG